MPTSPLVNGRWMFSFASPSHCIVLEQIEQHYSRSGSDFRFEEAQFIMIHPKGPMQQPNSLIGFRILIKYVLRMLEAGVDKIQISNLIASGGGLTSDLKPPVDWVHLQQRMQLFSNGLHHSFIGPWVRSMTVERRTSG